MQEKQTRKQSLNQIIIEYGTVGSRNKRQVFMKLRLLLMTGLLSLTACTDDATSLKEDIDKVMVARETYGESLDRNIEALDSTIKAIELRIKIAEALQTVPETIVVEWTINHDLVEFQVKDKPANFSDQKAQELVEELNNLMLD